MAVRAVSLAMGTFFFWALHASLQVLINIGRFPAIVGTASLALGILTGLAIGTILPLRQLRDINRKGESRTPLSTLLIIIGVAFVVPSALLLASNFSVDVLRLTLIFLSPSPAIVLAFQAFLFRRWEKKNGKWILAATWSAKYYVQPEDEQ